MALPVLLRNKFFAIALFAAIACNPPHPGNVAEKMVNSDSGNCKIQSGLMYEAGKLYSGTIFTLFTGTRDTAEICCFKNGKEHGTWKKFFTSKKLKSIRQYDDGKKVGEYIAWWDNGKPMLDYRFNDDEYNGICKEWNRNGMLIKEMNYRKGYEEGTQRSWYDNGKIRANYKMIDGRRYGLLGTKNCVNVSDSVFKN